jgi:prolyl oligopeptidase
MKYLTKIVFFLFFLIALSCSSPQDDAESFKYPSAAKIDHEDTYFDEQVPDPYHWLEDDASAQTAEWVSAENDVTFGYLDQIDFRDAVKSRLEKLIDYERASSPFKEGSFEYHYRNSGLQDHSVLYRTRLESDEEEEIYLDPNTFSEDGTIGLRGVFFTKDGTRSAHMISDGGSDWRKVIVMNTDDQTILEDTLVDVKFSGVSWHGNDGFYYSSYDKEEDGSQLSAKTQNHKLLYHQLGTPQSTDKLIFGGEQQPNRYINGFVTEDQNFLVVSAAQTTSGNQVYIKRLSGGDFIQIQDDYDARCSVIENIGNDFFMNTNIDAPNYRVVRVNVNHPEQAAWQDIIPESQNVLRASAGGGKIFANYLIDAKTAIFQYNMDGTLDWEIKLPGIGSGRDFNEKFDATELYYSFTSFTYPTSIFKYSIKTGESELYRRPEIEFNPEDYTTEQVFYASKDGTKVPMFITYKKDLKKDGNNPTYLYAYGGFNVSLTPGFSAFRVLWLENGGIYAQPNLRGGGEYGEEWHHAGTKMNKQNVFDDFIAAGEYLIANKYTSSKYLAIAGGSNGGLLVGATMTQRPDLAKVALPAVGVMDMLRYHTFTAGAGWASDYGTSEDSEEMFAYLKKYSPYHALTPGTNYPATMVTTSDHDDRVVPAHSFKFTARLQEYNEGENPVLIRVQTRAGHGSVSTKQAIDLAADKYSFAWYNMGVIPELAKKDL